MAKIILPSGASLEITLLPFGEAWELCQRVSSVLEKLEINIKDLEINIERPAELLQFKGPILSLLANKDISASAKECFKKCLYNGLKIDSDTFETRESRADYLPIVFYVLYENISPFFLNLLSYLSKKLETAAQKIIQK